MIDKMQDLVGMVIDATLFAVSLLPKKKPAYHYYKPYNSGFAQWYETFVEGDK